MNINWNQTRIPTQYIDIPPKVFLVVSSNSSIRARHDLLLFCYVYFTKWPSVVLYCHVFHYVTDAYVKPCHTLAMHLI